MATKDGTLVEALERAPAALALVRARLEQRAAASELEEREEAW